MSRTNGRPVTEPGSAGSHPGTGCTETTPGMETRAPVGSDSAYRPRRTLRTWCRARTPSTASVGAHRRAVTPRFIHDDASGRAGSPLTVWAGAPAAGPHDRQRPSSPRPASARLVHREQRGEPREPHAGDGACRAPAPCPTRRRRARRGRRGGAGRAGRHAAAPTPARAIDQRPRSPAGPRRLAPPSATRTPAGEERTVTSTPASGTSSTTTEGRSCEARPGPRSSFCSSRPATISASPLGSAPSSSTRRRVTARSAPSWPRGDRTGRSLKPRPRAGRGRSRAAVGRALLSPTSSMTSTPTGVHRADAGEPHVERPRPGDSELQLDRLPRVDARRPPRDRRDAPRWSPPGRRRAIRRRRSRRRHRGRR